MFNVLKDLSVNINNYAKSTQQSLHELVYYVLIDLSIPTRFQQIGQTKPEAERLGNHAVHHVQIPEAE
ncbi:hypothetical protein DAPPUDRAFT_236765 [Daphnia pulex]|uniref:Uncharacterized protein n=1 Tax=Daphnia pulex TaxID=6669 RepID=E9G315_DAPPU|nr:hypothetical protein DAPPUDRAFT_236765 [Daphnia pulex]|eukprot:EFX86137.1 hypothetical protein DAPPUDRAFT_236765 [Daphnia pulex]